ncbi:MAG: single-stranded-DNA-specific exonuclease RecJ [Candidatus Paceibacterota bacterium]|jgi:single-stranded-DNA-specific exonuclease
MQNYLIREKIPEDIEKEFADYPEILKTLLYYRNIKTKKDAEAFFNPIFGDNYDSFLMKGMDESVSRIFQAIDNNEKMVIFSDYDADGIPGAVVLHDFFKKIGYNNFENYIPHRVIEGFGLNSEAVDEFSKKEVKLIITVDCGIADIKESKKIRELGIDLIVTDHHLPKEELPVAFAILDSKQIDCNYPDKNLCGAGVVFKLVQGMISRLLTFNFINFKLEPLALGWEKWLLDMVGLATVSDMVPLIGENRIFAYFGLKVLQKTRRLGLQRLLSLIKVDQKHLTEDDIGFMITPRINAASRMGNPEDAFNMLVEENEVEADKYARHLDHINNERKGVVASLVKEIKKHWAEKDPDRKLKVLVAGNPDWKPSLLGLVANSLMDDHSGPVFLWGREEGKTLKGSCRSDGCVSIVEMMNEVKHLFDEYGGHSMSGGFSVSLEKVDILAEGLEIAYEKLKISDELKGTKYIDFVLGIDDVNRDLDKHISKLAPFGMDNPKPVFLFKNIEINEVKIFGKKAEHLELKFNNKRGQKISAIGFFMKSDDFEVKVEKGEKISLIANLEKSFFRGRDEVRLRIVDII